MGCRGEGREKDLTILVVQKLICDIPKNAIPATEGKNRSMVKTRWTITQSRNQEVGLLRCGNENRAGGKKVRSRK